MVEFGDTPQEFASKVVQLLRDPERCRRAGAEGRLRVGAEYDWAKSLDRLLALIQNPAASESNRHRTPKSAPSGESSVPVLSVYPIGTYEPLRRD